MTKKKKVAKSTKIMDYDTAFDIGWNAEQVLADTICSKISEDDEDASDTALIAALQALTCRMAGIWKKEFLLEVVTEVIDDVKRDMEQEHVCNDCQDRLDNGISTEVRNKMH